MSFCSNFQWNICSQDEGKGDGDGDGEKRFDGSGYDKDLVEALERDILQKNPNVHWYGMLFLENATYHKIPLIPPPPPKKKSYTGNSNTGKPPKSQMQISFQ